MYIRRLAHDIAVVPLLGVGGATLLIDNILVPAF
jgi:hypothetical protein